MDYTILTKAPLFRGLSHHEIESSLRNILFRKRLFKSGMLIAQSGEQVENFQMVLAGKVKGEMVDIAGRVIKIEEIPAAGAIAPAFMFGSRNRFPVNVITVTDSEILSVPKQEFLKLLTSDSRLLINFLDMISNRSQFLSDKIKFLNFKTIRGKLSQFILQKAGESAKINLGMTQNELADYFGVTRPSVARVLGALEEEGYISASGKEIIIKNREGLGLLVTD